MFHTGQGRRGPRGDQGDWSPPITEHLNFWWRPSFYPAISIFIHLEVATERSSIK